MNRYDFFFKQPVTEVEMNEAFDAVENAIWNLSVDNSLTGILYGIVGAQSGTPDLHVHVSGPGVAYDASGKRMFVNSPNEDAEPTGSSSGLANDSLGSPTTVVGAGNEKWIAVFLHFVRSLSDPRVDGNSMTVYYDQFESHEYVVRQGAEATIGTAPRVALDPTMVLLFDVHRIFGQTTFHNADIDITRRQDAFVLTQSPASIRAGQVVTALAAMLTNLNNHIGNVGNLAHPVARIELAVNIFSTSTGSFVTVGIQPIDFSQWPATTPAGNLTVRLIAVVSATNPHNAELELFNLTDSEVVTNSLVSSSSGTPVELTSSPIPVGATAGDLKLANKLYSVQFETDSGGNAATLYSAHLQITYE